MNFNNKDEVALIHKHLSTEIYTNYGISLSWIETIRKYIEYLEVKNKEFADENKRLKHECDDCAGCTQLNCDCANIEAYIVWKMQEMLNQRIDRVLDVFDFDISECNAIRQVLRGIKDDIYQVAKELMESEE